MATGGLAFRIGPEAGEGLGMYLLGTGALATVSGDAAVRQALMILLATTQGERVMRPDYGCGLRHLAFAPNDMTTAGLAIHYVRQAVERWEPRVELLRVDTVDDADMRGQGQLILELDYRVLASGRTERLSLSLDLEQGLAR